MDSGSNRAVMFELQWGPVVVTGIRARIRWLTHAGRMLQWGPVVVTGIRLPVMNSSPSISLMLQWGPVVVTGISSRPVRKAPRGSSFNGVRSW